MDRQDERYYRKKVAASTHKDTMAAVAYALRYAGTEAAITTAMRRESNNYRKMHGLPMKRRWRRAKHGAGRGYGYR